MSLPEPDIDSGRIALLSRGLTGGGVQAMMRNTAVELVARGYRVDLICRRRRGDRGIEPPAGVSLRYLPTRPRAFGRWQAWRAAPDDFDVLAKPVLFGAIASDSLALLPALKAYLTETRPAGLISATTYANLAAIWARTLAGVSTRLLLSERDDLAQNLAEGVARRAWRWRHAPPLIARTYPRAEAIVGVSNGVADSLAKTTGLARDTIHTVYNPVVTPDLAERAAAPIDEPWLTPGAPPVIVTAGRLVAKKDYPTLVQAFARLRATREARLMLLGDGPERDRIQAEAARLGVAADVKLKGWVPKPVAYMSRAAAFALSSTREGFGNVLVEALAVGCPTVSTDCPSGPAEILGDGAYGRLVPMRDPAALAEALNDLLATPPDRARLKARGADFTAARATTRYLDLLGLPDRAPGT